MNLTKIKWMGVLAVLVCTLCSCVSSIDQPMPEREMYAALDRTTLREAYLDAKASNQEDPTNVTVLIRLRTLAQQLTLDYSSDANREALQGNIDQALLLLDQAISLIPESESLIEQRNNIAFLHAASRAYAEASVLFERKSYQKVIDILHPFVTSAKPSVQLIALYQQAGKLLSKREREKFKIDLEFNELDVKDALVFVAGSFGIDVVFDASVKKKNIDLNVRDIPFVDAVQLIVDITDNRYKVINDSTLLIYADSKDRRRVYDPIAAKTYYLQTMLAKEMAGILKSVLDLKDITINESNNSIIVRSNRQLLELAGHVIAENDVPPGEVVLDVEILEINLSEAQRLGVDLGNYQITASTQQVPVSGSIADSITAATSLGIPNLNLNAFKQAVDAKSLARPSIRVLDGEKAKIHIGDRVPLRKSSIQDATGQTRTTFEYQEIGIRFTVEASIRSADKVTVNVGLEVSSLGENLGTSTEQAFRIGTRNADTTMLVNNGETAILGGLLRDEQRSTGSGLAGLSSFTNLLSNSDKSAGRTDLLLTITPHIVRTGKSSRGKTDIYSLGTEDRLGIVNSSSELERLVLRKLGVAEIENRNPAKVEELVAAVVNDDKVQGTTKVASKPAEPIKFELASDQFLIGVNDEVEVELTCGCGAEFLSATIELSGNEKIAEIISVAEASEGIDVELQKDEGGGVQIILSRKANVGSIDSIAVKIKFKGLRRGTTFYNVQQIQETAAANVGRVKFVVR